MEDVRKIHHLGGSCRAGLFPIAGHEAKKRRRRGRWLYGLAALPLLSFAGSASAQVAIDGSLTHSAPNALLATGGVYQIPADLGRVSGPNLLQSFQVFDLASGQTAVFTGPAIIHNIIARVTGGSASTIDGRIDASAFPSVNFYLLNPAGIIVGPGASASVPGSFYLSTASTLGFADGQSLPVTATSVGTLSVADPVSFGFVGHNAPVTFNGAGIDDLGQAHAGTIWSSANIQGSRFLVAAGDVSFNNFGIQLAGGMAPAEIDAVAMGGSTSGMLDLNAPNSAAAATGQISIRGGFASPWSVTNANGFGGGIVLAGGNISLIGPSLGGASDFNLGVTGGDINLLSSGDLLVDSSFLTTSPSAAVRAGTIRAIVAGTATLENSSGLSVDAVGAWDGGAIDLTANKLMLDDQSFIAADTFDAGAAGHITLHVADSLHLAGTSSISADSGNGTIKGFGLASLGAAGTISIEGGTVTLADGAGIKAISSGGGDAGSLHVTVGTLALGDQSYLTADQLGGGASGSIDVTAGTVQLVGGAAIKSDNYGAGTGGRITLGVGSLSLSDQSLIAIDTFGAGSGGLIKIVASGNIAMTGAGSSGGSAISAQSERGATGGAGSVSIQANALTLSGQAGIKVSSFGSGMVGGMTLQLSSLSLADQSYIASDTFGPGAGGQTAITVVGGVALSGQSSISSDSGTATSPSSQVFGKAGDINLTAGTLSLTQGAGIKSNAFGAGNAGSIHVSAGGATLADQSYLASDTYGMGAGGNIGLSLTGALVLSGQSVISADALLGTASPTPESVQQSLQGASGTVTVKAASVQLSNAAGIRTSTERAGVAGAISVTTNSLSLGDQSYLASDAHASGNAGSVSVTAAASLALSGSAFLGARSHDASNAGRITIVSPVIALSGLPQISSEAFGAGAAGDVTLSGFDSLTLSGGASISSSSTGSKGLTAGLVTITGNAGALLSITGGSSIKTDSASNAPAGDIMVSADRILIDGTGSEISSANSSASGGSAGQITIDTDPLTLSNGGRITTDATNGPAGDITLNFPGAGLLFLEGSAAPGVIATSSGTNTGGRITISHPYAIIMNGGRIEALGPAFQALVTIDADWLVRSSDQRNDLAVAGRLLLDSQVEDVSRGTQRLSVAFADAYGVLVGHCAATRGNGATSTLDTGSVTGPYAAAPQATACHSPDKAKLDPASQISSLAQSGDVAPLQSPSGAPVPNTVQEDVASVDLHPR